jgi:plasmid maintenance system antidote protein VapI
MSMTTQAGIPVDVTPREIEREKSLGGAIALCAKAAGFELDKTLQQELEVDKAQFSRWQSGQEGIVWAKFVKLMDVCGNDAPLMWMLHQRGYDLNSLRRQETELERENRLLREELEREKSERAIERRLFTEIRGTA